MPFPRKTESVTDLFEFAREEIRAIFDLMDRAAEIVDVGSDPVGVRIFTRENRRSRRAADGTSRVGILEEHTFSGKGVDIRCFTRSRSIGANRGEAVLIGHNEEDIGFGHAKTVPNINRYVTHS